MVLTVALSFLIRAGLPSSDRREIIEVVIRPGADRWTADFLHPHLDGPPWLLDRRYRLTSQTQLLGHDVYGIAAGRIGTPV